MASTGDRFGGFAVQHSSGPRLSQRRKQDKFTSEAQGTQRIFKYFFFLCVSAVGISLPVAIDSVASYPTPPIQPAATNPAPSDV
jgi:hypothetical protein